MKDDGIGVKVLESLKDKLEAMGTQVIIAETDTLFCFSRLSDDDYVIILDAAYSNRAAGSIHCCTLKEAANTCSEGGSLHDMGILDLIRLYSSPLRGCFIGIEISEAGYGYELSEALKAGFSDICIRTDRIIRDIVEEEIYMHDTFLNERIYEALLELCKENKLSRISKAIITVNVDSHITESSLREYFSERSCGLLGDSTEIIVERQDVGKLNAVIRSIEGELSDE